MMAVGGDCGHIVAKPAVAFQQARTATDRKAQNQHKSLSVIFRAFSLLISERKQDVGNPARLGKMEIGGGISFS
jgi:hypothetical protein